MHAPWLGIWICFARECIYQVMQVGRPCSKCFNIHVLRRRPYNWVSWEIFEEKSVLCCIVLQGNVFIKSCKSEGHVLNGLTFMFLGEGHTTESLGKFLRKKAFCAAFFSRSWSGKQMHETNMYHYFNEAAYYTLDGLRRFCRVVWRCGPQLLQFI